MWLRYFYTGFGYASPGAKHNWAATLPLFSIFHNFDTPSTICLDKLLILNVLYVIANIETRHATSLHVIESSFDTPSTGQEVENMVFKKTFVFLDQRIFPVGRAGISGI